MLVEIIIKNNGATINKKGQCVQLKSGYQVSKRDCLKIAVEDLTEQIVEELIATGLNRGEYAGFWLDNGFIYADISVRIATKKQAILQGIALNQIAVWDLRKNISILCKA
jgi:hypothetical protein